MLRVAFGIHVDEVDGGAFDQFAEQPRRIRGFVTELDHLMIPGRCADCAANAPIAVYAAVNTQGRHTGKESSVDG